jgi:hypothetical protein
MCVIITLGCNASIKKEHLFNAVANNWHGFGLIIKKGNTLEVVRKFDDEGSDPGEIWGLLEANKQYERVLHVRFNTRGASDLTNTQPFNVMKVEGGREVWFAHNGTLHSYGDGQSTGKSDTLDFADSVLLPILGKWSGELGLGDYTDPTFLKVITKFWSPASKGLLFSNDLSPLRFGDGWSSYIHTGESEGEVWVSNKEYFDKITRGPTFQKMEAERKAKEAEERAKTQEIIPFGGNSSPSQLPLHVWSGNTAKDPRIIKAVNDIVDTWQLEDAEEVALLSNVSFDEWMAVVEDQDKFSLAALIQRLSQHLYEVVIIDCQRKDDKLDSLQGKLDRATKRIAELSNNKENDRAA